LIVALLATLGATVVAFVLYPVFAETRARDLADLGETEREILDLEEKKGRLHVIEALQEQIGSQINARLVGTVQEVLVEGEKDGVLTGRNRGNKLVHVRAEMGNGKWEMGRPHPTLGELIDVRISKATAWSLQGEIASTVAA